MAQPLLRYKDDINRLKFSMDVIGTCNGS